MWGGSPFYCSPGLLPHSRGSIARLALRFADCRPAVHGSQRSGYCRTHFAQRGSVIANGVVYAADSPVEAFHACRQGAESAFHLFHSVVEPALSGYSFLDSGQSFRLLVSEPYDGDQYRDPQRRLRPIRGRPFRSETSSSGEAERCLKPAHPAGCLRSSGTPARGVSIVLVILAKSLWPGQREAGTAARRARLGYGSKTPEGGRVRFHRGRCASVERRVMDRSYASCVWDRVRSRTTRPCCRAPVRTIYHSNAARTPTIASIFPKPSRTAVTPAA